MMQTYLWIVLGVVVSVVLPPLWRLVRLRFPEDAPQPKGMSNRVGAAWELLKPYALLGLASALTALLVLAFVDKPDIDFRTAFLAGYAWDATLQKLKA